jgi:hypothetical protein
VNVAQVGTQVVGGPLGIEALDQVVDGLVPVAIVKDDPFQLFAQPLELVADGAAFALLGEAVLSVRRKD